MDIGIPNEQSIHKYE